MALADVDGDGDLDLYVANYRASTFKDLEEPTKMRLRSVNGVVQVPPERADQFVAVPSGDGYDLVEIGEPDVLYLDDGHGHFSAVPWTSGTFLNEDGTPLAAPPGSGDWRRRSAT